MVKVSIIIPIYNVEKYIRKALDSICKQTLQDFECICIDDCSTDSSKEIVQEYTLKDSRFKLIELSENKGQGLARNIGIKEAQGEYLMFLDPDDWYANNACEIAYNNVRLNKSDIGTFNNFRYYEKNNELVLFNFCEEFRPVDGSCCKHIFRTNFIKENGVKFGEGRNCEDNPFFLKSMILTDKISRINVPLYYYRRRKDNSSARRYFSRSLEILDAKEECYKIIKTKANKAPYWSLAYCINSTLGNFDFYYNRFINKNLKKDFYNKTREFFKRIEKDYFYHVNFTNEIKQKEFNKIIKYNYYQYNAINFIEDLFVKASRT